MLIGQKAERNDFGRSFFRASVVCFGPDGRNIGLRRDRLAGYTCFANFIFFESFTRFLTGERPIGRLLW